MVEKITISDNIAVYDEFCHEYTDYSLYPPEREIIIKFKPDWHKFRVLDIGCGTGRTSMTFAAIAKEYVGIDYSLGMINKCKSVIREDTSTKLLYGDARNLSHLYGDQFDFILFSLNGIDSVSHEDRLTILSEVRKVVKPNGYFFFSTHSIFSFPYKKKSLKFNHHNILRSIYQCWKSTKFNYQLSRHQKKLDQKVVLAKPWTILISGDHDFKMPIYLINPEYQVKQLFEQGFDVVSVYDQKGKEVNPLQHKLGGFLYFLCSPISGA